MPQSRSRLALSLRMPRTFLVRIAPFWVACLVATSLQPWRPSVAHEATAHRSFHFLAFGSTAFLLLLIGRSTKQRILGPLGVIALGIAIEYMQNWIFGCPLEWWDMRDDALAVAAAWLIGQWAAIRRALIAEG